MRAAWALASAKALVSSYLLLLSFPQGALLERSGVVSVMELCLATGYFHISPYSDVRTFLRISVDVFPALVNSMTNSEVSCPTR